MAPPRRTTAASWGEDASSPEYIFAQPRVGYRMVKGKTTEESEA